MLATRSTLLGWASTARRPGDPGSASPGYLWSEVEVCTPQLPAATELNMSSVSGGGSRPRPIADIRYYNPGQPGDLKPLPARISTTAPGRGPTLIAAELPRRRRFRATASARGSYQR